MSAYIHTGWVHGKEPCTRNNNWGPELWEVERSRLRLSQSDYFDCFSFSVWDTVAMSSFSSLFFVPVSRLDGRWTLLRVRHTGWTCLNWADATFDIIDIQELFNRFIIISGLIDQPPWQPLLFTALLRFLLIYWFVSGPQFILPSTHKHWKDVLWVSLLILLFLCLVKKMDLTLSHQVCLSCVPMGGWSVPIIPSVHRQEPINSQWKTCGSIMRECNQPKGIRAGVCEWWWPGRRRIWIKWSCLEAYEWAMNEWGRDMVGWVGN